MKEGMGDISFFINPDKKLLKTLNPNVVYIKTKQTNQINQMTTRDPKGDFN